MMGCVTCDLPTFCNTKTKKVGLNMGKIVGKKRNAQIDAGEHYQGGDVPGRVENVQAIMSDPNFVYDLEQSKSKDGAPLLVLGDMNTPSHLDYTDAARNLHCGWAYQWPVTLALLGAGANLTDAYRYLYPDPVAQPGNTWSTAQKFQDGWGGTIPEPQDRIDMVLYRSPVLRPVRADIYSGTELESEPIDTELACRKVRLGELPPSATGHSSSMLN
uniref:Endonuclease/exonuclease/phosphatase domain-containing protein n=1 Tax=Romanomermis culicivorax TaxID=13658 RepID=A0A915I9P6_ROMCU